MSATASAGTTPGTTSGPATAARGARSASARRRFGRIELWRKHHARTEHDTARFSYHDARDLFVEIFGREPRSDDPVPSIGFCVECEEPVRL